ncbi:MAG: DUF3971 domain-containing protein [Proteobacteria bacterium]|nr:DUF3971 domain-containing protein [Pseudomonadota bacterium]
MTSTLPKRVARFLIGTLSVLIASTAVLVGACLLRLYHEPLDLSPYTQDVAKALKPVLGHVDLSLTAPRLVWHGIGHPLEVETRDLVLRREGAADPIVRAPQVRFSFRFRSLLVGQFLPATLTLVQPTLWVDLPQAPDASQDNTVFSFVEETFLTPSHSKTLKRLHIENAQIHVTHGPKKWDVPGTTFIFERKRGGLDIVAQITAKTASFSAHLAYAPDARTWQGNAHLQGVPVMEVLGDLSDMEGPWQGWYKMLDGSRLTMSGEGSFDWGAAQGVRAMSLNVSAGAGVLNLPTSLLEKPLAFQKADLKGEIKDGQLTITDTLFLTQGATLKLTGRGRVPTPASPKGDLALEAVIGNLPMARLAHLWPEKAAPDARAWLVQNIPQGMATKATAALKGALLCEEGSMIPCFTFEGLNGEIFLDKAKLTYLPTMPAVTDLKAHAVYDQNHFDIAVEKGTSNGLSLSKGRVLIADMTGDAPHLSLKVGVDGPLPKAFEIINCKPLEALKDLPVSLKDPKGGVKGTFELAFPLKDVLESQDFIYGVDMQVTGLALHKILSQVGMDLTDASAHVTIKDRALGCDAKGLVNGDKGDISLKVGLGDKGHTLLKARVLGSAPGLSHLGFNLAPYMTGHGVFDIVFANEGTAASHLDVRADLRDAVLSYGAWTKAAQTHGTLKGRLVFGKGGLEALQGVTLQAPQADIALDATFGGKDGGLKTLVLSKGILGQSEAHVRVGPHKHRDLLISVQAKTLDLAPYISTLKEPSTGDASLGRTFDLKLSADKMILGEKQVIKGNTLSLSYVNERVQNLTYKGHFDEDLKKFFYIDIFPRAQDGRRFRLKCENGGAFFKAFDLTRNLSKGTLKIAAEQTRGRSAPWVGKIEYDNFWVKDAPLLGRLLSLAFPTGFVNFFSDKGMQFDRLKAHFTLGTTKLIVPKGFVQGPSLGMTMKGSLADHFENLHFSGNIYPAYFVNNAISKIPLLGQLLTGGKHEGLWGVSYTITGPRSDPKIGVNPLSVFTPGVLRKLFSLDDEDDLTLDDADMDNDKVVE